MKPGDPLHTFVIECRDLLEQTEEALMRIDLAPEDAETIDAVFRAVRAIRGSAGLFARDSLSGSGGELASLLIRVRSAELRIDSQMSALQLAVFDHLGLLASRVVAAPLPLHRY